LGHIRLGRLPKRKNWIQVCELLSSESINSQALAVSISKAAQNSLLRDENQRGLFQTVRYLIRLVQASRTEDFSGALKDIGIVFDQEESGMVLLGHILEKIKDDIHQNKGNSHLDSIASTAFQETLTKTIHQYAQTLFGCSIEDVRSAFKRYSSKNKFGEIARLLFSTYLTRIFQYTIDRAISENVGVGKKFNDVNSVLEFQKAIKTYCWDISKIVEEYSGGWYSKHEWEGTLSDAEIKRFTSYALKKLLSEINEDR
jgi:hypothetical protein